MSPASSYPLQDSGYPICDSSYPICLWQQTSRPFVFLSSKPALHLTCRFTRLFI